MDETASRAWMSWSSGKDSALALHRVRETTEVEVVGLLTTVNSAFERVAMHGVRRALLDAQAAALGLPVHVVELPWPCTNEVYEHLMTAMVASARDAGIDTVVFGDLFLEDVRRYRERSLEGTGLRPLFPLWQRPTAAIARELLELDVRAIVSCVDPSQAPRELAGHWYDEAFLAALPPGVDPCGENGEFHTVVVNGPGFSGPIAVTVGETVERDGFVFADVIPEPTA
ncbi:MAG TPA: ATP-binding protein [Solirubrobacteraceae bacterium]|jgi:uncharacterized protein (TIGR00290 family)|nr:ATP-binding protein [Solirubrobacteraceae bacterium]